MVLFYGTKRVDEIKALIEYSAVSRKHEVCLLVIFMQKMLGKSKVFGLPVLI